LEGWLEAALEQEQVLPIERLPRLPVQDLCVEVLKEAEVVVERSLESARPEVRQL
jgi:hypothetical protein